MLKLENVGKIYSSGSNVSIGIRKVNLELKRGEFVAITGESGSGKSTLLNILSGIDTYEEGEMYVFNEETSYFSIEDLENYRNKYVGFIFQNYNIIDSYSVYKNVEVALMLNGVPKEERKKKAIELINRVGLSHRMRTKASKLSGGEKQRVVIARALSKDPMIIAADEPTGNLDSNSSKEIIELLHEVSKDKLVLIVTHDFNEVSDYATRIIRVYDGEIKEDRLLKKDVIEEETPTEEVTFDNEKPKVKESGIIGLSLTDLFSSPKRSIFYYFVILLMGLYFLVALGAYRNLSRESNVSLSLRFANTDPYRMVVNKKDKSVLSNSDLEYLESLSSTDYIVKKDMILDYYAGLYKYDANSGEDFYINNFVNSASHIKERDLVAGRLPNSDSEIVITVTRDSLNEDYSEFKSFLNQEVNISTYDDSNNNKKYTVVGVIDGSSFNMSQEQYAYFYNDEFMTLSLNYYLSQFVNILIKPDGSTDYYQYSTGLTIYVDDNLSAGEACMNGLSETPQDIKIQDLYGTLLDLKLKYKSSSVNIGYNYNAFILNRTDYDNLINTINNRDYQVTIMLKNSSRAEYVRRTLISNGYNVVIPSIDTKTEFDITGLVKGIYFFMTSSFILQSILIIYVVLLHSIKSRKDDIEILRTIGSTKKQIRRMFAYEFTFIGSTVYLFIVILFIALKMFTKGTFHSVISAITFGDFLLLLFVILLINFLLSLLFTRRMFKNTVRKSLQEN